MIGKEKLKEIILSNRDFITTQVGEIIKRDNIKLPEKLNKVVILYGVRRSGKTFVLFDLFRKHKEKSLYIDFEDERLTGFEIEDFDVLKDAFLELFPFLLSKRMYFFLDEVQNINGWERFCRRAVERENIKVFVAGSSSRIMPYEIHSSLRGREWSLEVMPFSFKEYLKAKKVELDKNYIYGPKKVLIKRHFSQYLKWGGFPEVVTAGSVFEKRKVINEYLSAMFFKDIVERFNMSNTALVDTLTERLFSAFSSKFSLRAFYRQYKDVFPFSKDTLYNYYKNFLDSGLIFEVKKFAESTYKRQRNPAKIYVADSGLARRVTSEDLGRILENIVFLELRKDAEEIFYFDEEYECDFVVKKGNNFFPYQVCYELNEDNRQREIEGLIECCKRLKQKKGMLLTEGQEEQIVREGINIAVLPVWKWLLRSESKK